MPEGNGSFVRWQRTSIEQTGFVNNVLIGLAAGMIAFLAAPAIEKGLRFTQCGYWFYVVSLSMLFLSLVAGVLTAWTRLTDFRKTAEIARLREKGEKPDQLESLRLQVHCIGERTRVLLLLQVVLLCLGAFAVVVVALLQTHQ